MTHILLTNLGTLARETQYQWRGQTATGQLTPLALVQLLDHKPERIVTVVTKKAKETTWPIFQEAMGKILGFTPESPIEIPEGRNSREIRQILEKVAQQFPKGATLTLDITQGMRHIPFFFYAVTLYLTSLRGVTLQGAYYGMLEADSDLKPIIDLQPLLELPEWFHAVRMFQDQGATLPMAQLIQPLEKSIRLKAQQKQRGSDAFNQIQQQARHMKHVGKLLTEHAFAYEAALPLELGHFSRQLIQPVRQLAEMDLKELPPLVSELTEAVAKVAETRSLAQSPSRKGKWKQHVSLDETELLRQADLIDFYLGLNQLPLAIGLMREWVVSWLMLQSGQIENWYSPDNRHQCEWDLNTLRKRVQNSGSEITPAQKCFGEFWHQVTELRNALHHHGMREDALSYPPTELPSVLCFWQKLKADQVASPVSTSGRGRLLITGIGKRPGTLYSALKIAQPDYCIVVCLEASADGIHEAAGQAAFPGSVECVVLADPHGDFDQISQAAEQAQPWLQEADEVMANMTGGTVLMGLVVQQLVEKVRSLKCPVRRFALVDRRSQAQQDREPFVQSDCHWLDLDPET